MLTCFARKDRVTRERYKSSECNCQWIRVFESVAGVAVTNEEYEVKARKATVFT